LSTLALAAHAAATSAITRTQTIGGFSILQAESREALTAVLNEHPHFMMPGATIEVHEFLPIPGM